MSWKTWNLIPSVLDMIKAIQPLMGPLQEKLDKILYPNVADDVATVRELLVDLKASRDYMGCKTVPVLHGGNWYRSMIRLAPRVLGFADNYQADA